MAKEIVVAHARDVQLGKRIYHYLLSGLVSQPARPAPPSPAQPSRRGPGK